MTTFATLGLQSQILKALDEQGYHTPTPIQAQAIPHVLAGKDVFGCAQTGTGKTAAFALPILQHLATTKTQQHGETRIQALILTPTRELAIQIGENIDTYGAYTGLTSTVIFGGVSQVNQVKILRKGVDILVATPGRLLDLINQKHINLSRIKIFVLDEADRMLDMGFVADVKKILTRIPKHRQTLFFSATMIPSIMDLAHTILKDPVQVKVTPVSSTVDTVTQSLYTVSKEDKKNLLLHILQNPAVKSAVVFTKTKHGANKVEKILSQAKIPSAALHGNKSQNARQQALAKLKDGSIRVLVATDIAARGIDIDQLSHVIIHDVPLEPEVYVHRIGRTGRAGMRGDALMFCEPSEVKYLKQIVKVIGKDIPHVKDHPYHSPHSTTVVTEQPKPQRNLPPRNQRGAPLPGQSRQGARGNQSGQQSGGQSGQRSNHRSGSSQKSVTARDNASPTGRSFSSDRRGSQRPGSGRFSSGRA